MNSSISTIGHKLGRSDGSLKLVSMLSLPPTVQLQGWGVWGVMNDWKRKIEEVS